MYLSHLGVYIRKNLKTVIILIMTHAADNTGYLGTSSTRHVCINDMRNFSYGCVLILSPIPCNSGLLK